ncbi:MAG: hypothetical protein SPK36_00840 [Bacilli bacterium]|nr:hypothetical protein [Bacilli bacterium]
MKKYNADYLEEYYTQNYNAVERVINKHEYRIWPTVKNYLNTGKLHNKEEALICYNELKNNKEWYYKMNKDYELHYTVLNDGTIVKDDYGEKLFNKHLEEEKEKRLEKRYNQKSILLICRMVFFALNGIFGVLSICTASFLFIVLNIIILIMGIISTILYQFNDNKIENEIEDIEKEVKYLLLDKDIDELEQELKHYLEMDIIQENISNKFEKCLQREKSVDCTPNIANKQNDKQVSKFVQLIGENIKLIFANPYPDCENDINALNELANEYVKYIIASSSTNELIIENNNFYNRLIDLEFKIHENIRNNMTKELNEEYLKKVMNKAPESVDTSKIYTDSVVCEQIPTIQEEFNMESQNYSADDTEDKGYGRILSHNDSSSK